MNEFDVLLARKLGGGSGDTYTKAQIDAKLAEKVGFSDIDSALSTTSENPVQNKVITDALGGKVGTTDYATANAAGIVKPDGVTTTVDADGTIHATNIDVTSWYGVRDVVRRGLASRFFQVGDQLVCEKDSVKIRWDIIGINHDTPSDSQYKYSLTLQLHDCIAELQFCARQALFAFPEGLAAGTYHFTIGAQPWYTSDVNKTVQFTLASAIAAGGQLVINNAYNATAIGSTISAFASATASTAAETVTMSEGSAGTDLGTVNNAKTATVNSIQQALLGSNNYNECALRMYLNSDKPAGQVWTPASVFDRAPSWAASSAGFLYGLDPEFVKVLGKVKKKTALNTVSDGGGSIETDEKVFLLSLSEIYAGDNITGGEGTPYAYYSMFSDYNAPNTGADTNRIKYRAGAAKYWWLRSPSVGGASHVRVVTPSGTITHYNATYSNGVAPACVIV